MIYEYQPDRSRLGAEEATDLAVMRFDRDRLAALAL
jgi:hypothetical protein